MKPEFEDAECLPSLASLKGLKGKEYSNAWNKLHRIKMREVDKRYRSNHSQKIREKNKKQGKAKYAKNPEIIKALKESQKATGQYKISQDKYRAGYYGRYEKAPWRGQPWGVVEECMVMEKRFSDHELSEKLGRSIQAIQVKRCRLHKQNLEEKVQ